jgi:hypothetical protein
VKESLDFKHEQQTAAIAAKPETVRRSATVLVLAGRGSLDLAAAQLIAEAIRLDLGIVARCPSLGGLTGIAAAAEAGGDAPRISSPSSPSARSRRRSWISCCVG